MVENGQEEETVSSFETKAQAYAKKIIANFQDFEFVRSCWSSPGLKSSVILCSTRVVSPIQSWKGWLPSSTIGYASRSKYQLPFSHSCVIIYSEGRRYT